MNFYEVMLIIRPDIETEQHQEVMNDLKTAISKEGGEVSTVLDWRKRRLSYEINKHKEGHYYLVYFSGQGTIIPEVEHFFRVTDAVIRYLVSAVEESEFNAAAEKAAAEAAAAEKAEAEKAAKPEPESTVEEPAEEQVKETVETEEKQDAEESVEEAETETIKEEENTVE